MGLEDGFFWSLSMSRFLLLWERYRDREKQADRRSGVIAAILAEIHRDEKVRKAPFDWTDFFPEWREPHPPQTEEEMLQVMEMWVAATKERD